jgi:hypothetical protein
MHKYEPHTSIVVRLASVEYFAAALTAVWGMWLMALPNVAAETGVYAVFIDKFAWLSFGALTDNQTLGLIGLLVGIFYAVAIRINGKGITWTPFMRGFGALSGTFFFSYMWRGAFSHSPYSAGVPTFFFLSIGFFTLFYLNLGRVWEALYCIKKRRKKWATQ